MATTNSTNVGSPNANAEISVLVKTDYESYMWDRAVANFVHARFGKPAVINKGKGGKKEWRRLSAMSAQTTPLDEDNTPDAIALTWEDKQAEPLEYGAWVRYTHFLEFRSIDPLILETAQLLGENCGDTIDKITRDELASGFTVIQYQNGLANLAAVTSGLYFTYETLVRAVSTGDAANARPIEGFGKPVLICHPHVIGDLALDTTVQKGWDNRARLSQGNPYEEGFVGEIYGVLIYKSSNCTVTTQSSAPDIYDSLLIFNNAYGVVGLAEKVRYVGTGICRYPTVARWSIRGSRTRTGRSLRDAIASRHQWSRNADSHPAPAPCARASGNPACGLDARPGVS